MDATTWKEPPIRKDDDESDGVWTFIVSFHLLAILRTYLIMPSSTLSAKRTGVPRYVFDLLRVCDFLTNQRNLFEIKQHRYCKSFVKPEQTRLSVHT